MNKKIYDLDLHESMEIEGTFFSYLVTRVPGGWIYSMRKIAIDIYQDHVFIPNNPEFITTI